METKLIVVAICLMTFQACTIFESEKVDFYKDSSNVEGLFRYPIIEPYDLITTEPSYGWVAGSAFGRLDINTALDSVNYQNGYITFWGVSTGVQYGILNSDSSQLYVDLSYKQFCEKANALGVSCKLFDTHKVYETWKRTRQLPWGVEILKKNGFVE